MRDPGWETEARPCRERMRMLRPGSTEVRTPGEGKTQDGINKKVHPRWERGNPPSLPAWLQPC